MLLGCVLQDLEQDFERGVPLASLKAQLLLLSEVAATCTEQHIPTRTVDTLRRMLTDYSIEQPSALRILLKLLLRHTTPHTAAVIAAAEICAAALTSPTCNRRPEQQLQAETDVIPQVEEARDRKQPCKGHREGSAVAKQPTVMLLQANQSVRVAALQTAIQFWRGHVDRWVTLPLHTLPARVDGLLRAVSESLCIHLVRKSSTMSCPVVVQSIFALVAALFHSLGRVAVLLRTHLRGAATGASIATEGCSSRVDARRSLLEPWIRAWQLLAVFMPDFLTWLRDHRKGWSNNCRQRVPSMLYACERMHLQLIALLHLPGLAVAVECQDLCHVLQRTEPGSEWRQVDRARRNILSRDNTSRTITDSPGNRESSKSSRSMRRQPRSRNAYIDAVLVADACHLDSFADLEDFIIYKQGRKY
jgi:hypothetical protein